MHDGASAIGEDKLHSPDIDRISLDSVDCRTRPGESSVFRGLAFKTQTIVLPLATFLLVSFAHSKNKLFLMTMSEVAVDFDTP